MAKPTSTVKVRSTGTGETFDANSADAQEGFARGTVEIEGEKVRVVSGDNKSGTVNRADLGEALAQGWKIATEDEAAAKSARREASGVVGTTVGLAEAGARGASLGLSDVGLAAIGVDTKGMAARQEALGEAGTAAEVAGAIGATVLTGGTAGAAQGGARAGTTLTAKQIAKRGLAGIGAPTRLATRAGDAVAGAVLGTGEAGLGRTIAAKALGGAVEGGLGGVGSVMSEAVLHDKELTGEALLGGIAAGALFGAATEGGMSAAWGGLAKGAGATRGTMRQLLSRETGMPPASITDDMIDAAAGPKDSWLATTAEKLAPLSGTDPVIAKRVYQEISTPAGRKRVNDLMNRRSEVEMGVAETFQSGLNNVRKSLDDAHMTSQGEAKYSSMAGKLPRNADFVAPRITEELRGGMETRLAAMVEENAANFGRAYDVGAVRETGLLVKRAFEESLIDGGGAMASFRSMDRLKRDLQAQIKATGGWGTPPMGTTTDVTGANKALKEMYGDVQKHLERNDLWGAAADQQRELNQSFAASQRAAAEFKQIATGSGVRGLFAPDGSVNMRQAISLARQFRRMGGSEVAGKFDEVLNAQLAHLDVVKKYYDLGPEGAASIDAAHASVKDIREKLASQADDAALLDDIDSMRNSESGASVSMGALSTVGPSIGAMIGMGALGPVGAAVGSVAGGITRPYSTLRTMSSLLAITDKFKVSFDAKSFVATLSKKTAGARKKLEELTKDAADVGKRASRGAVVGGAFQVAKYKTTSDRQRDLAEKADRVSKLGTAEDLRAALGPEWEALSADFPELAAQFEGQVQRAVGYLDKHRPQVHRRPYSGRPPMVNPAEAATFERRYRAVTQPQTVVERLKSGRLTVEEVDALREVYPRHYAQLVEGIQEALVAADERGEAPSHADRVRLGIVLGQPLDSSLEPAHLRAMAAVYGSAPPVAQQQQQAAPRRGSGKIRAAGVDKLDPSRLETSAETTSSGRLRA